MDKYLLLCALTIATVGAVKESVVAPVDPKLAIPYLENPKFDENLPESEKEAGRASIAEFEMRTMTAKDPVKTAARENLPASDPLSVVSICLDTDTWGVLKLFADSVPLVRLDRHLAEYRVDDHESVLDWIGSPAPDLCLLDFDHDRRTHWLPKGFMPRRRRRPMQGRCP